MPIPQKRNKGKIFFVLQLPMWAGVSDLAVHSLRGVAFHVGESELLSTPLKMIFLIGVVRKEQKIYVNRKSAF